MKRPFSHRTFWMLSWIVLLLASVPQIVMAEPSVAASAAFSAYVGSVEARLLKQHLAAGQFFVFPSGEDVRRLRRGEAVIETLTPKDSPPGALLHHWRGTAFVPGASCKDFERLMKDFNNYPRIYAPEVLKAEILAQQGDHLTGFMRVRQKHVIAVVMDTTYDVRFGRLDPEHGYSFSRSTQISEIDAPGTASEHALTPAQEHGFLWRLNTYWSYEERDGGLYLQIESISLTRAIPHGLGWAVQPFVQSIPRESLEFTLQATANALRK